MGVFYKEVSPRQMKNRDPCPVALDVSKHELYVNILEYNNFLKFSISRVQLRSV